MKFNRHTLLPLIYIICVSHVFAITKTWNGSITAVSWSDPNNWLPIGVPQKGDDVIIAGTIDCKIGSTSDTLNSLQIQDGRTLTITNNGVIRVSTSISTSAIHIVNGKIANYGLIDIFATPSKGFLIESDGELESAGNIYIKELSEFGDEGIKNYGSVFIDGVLEITDLQYFGVWNYGTFEIGEMGTVYIHDFDSRGYQSTVDTSTNINRGILIIKAVTVGMNLNGLFLNHGSISLDSISSTGISSGDTLKNFDTGEIMISHVQGKGCSGNGFLSNEGYITINNLAGDGLSINTENYGEISISSCVDGIQNPFGVGIHNFGLITIYDTEHAIYSSGSLGPIHNYDSILIHNTSSHGMEVRGVVHNHPNGFIKISDVNGSDSEGIAQFNPGAFTNEGKILLDSLDHHGIFLLAGTFENNDSIQVRGYTSQALKIEGELINNTQGIIVITNPATSSGVGVRVEGGLLDNAGQIDVNQGLRGVELKFNGVVENAGTISVKNTTDVPLEIHEGSEITCTGTMDIGN